MVLIVVYVNAAETVVRVFVAVAAAVNEVDWFAADDDDDATEADYVLFVMV